MIFFIPWVVLIVVVILAVPIAAKLSPTPSYAAADPGDAEGAMEDGGEMLMDEAIEPLEEVAEPVGAADGDEFAEFG